MHKYRRVDMYIYLLNINMLHMMTHASLEKHASSVVSYFDKSALVSLLNKSMINIKYETNDDACFVGEACVIFCLILL